MEQYEQLFKAVSQIVQQVKVAKEESRLRGEQFNIFKVCGVDHYELQHSAIIAEILNPKGSHGQGCLYLKLFMETYGSSIDVANLDEKSIQVKREEWTSDYDGRMDIYVEYQKKPILIIENKLYARDQSIQLQRYDKDAQQRKADKYDIVYLTLDGKDATDDSAGNVNYNKMSYANDIIKWLNKCIEHSSRIPLVRETLIQYQNHIKQLTHQDMDNTKLNEMFEIMSTYPEETAILLNQGTWPYMQYVFEKYVRKLFEDYAQSNGLIYAEDGIWNSGEGGFYFYKREWKHYAVFLWHEKWSEGWYIGVSWYGKEPEEKLEIHKLECLSDAATPAWPYGTAYLDKYCNWNEFTTIDMMSGDFSNAITDYVSRVIKEIENKGLPML